MQDIASSTLSGLGFVWMHRLIARLWSSLVEEHKMYAYAGITQRMRACLRVVHSFSHSECGEKRNMRTHYFGSLDLHAILAFAVPGAQLLDDQLE